jgi:hypothetical protein
MTTVESPYDLKGVGKDDVLFVCADDDDNSNYAFNVPGAEQKVWIARIINVIEKGENLTDTFKFQVVFGQNEGADITKVITFDDQKEDTYEMLQVEDNILYYVCDYEEGLKLSKRNIRELSKNMNEMN